MNLSFECSIFHHFWHSFGARVWDIFSISGNALMNHFFSIVISCRNRKTFLWGFDDLMHLCIKSWIFHNFGLILGPHFLIISQFQAMRLWITSSASCKIEKTALWGFVNPMHLFIKSSIFYNCWHNFGARVWDIFSVSENGLMNHFFSIVISCKKAKKRFHQVLRIRWTFSLKVQFFKIFGKALVPEFEISFSISGNALMKHFFSIVISCKKAKNVSVRFCGSDETFH